MQKALLDPIMNEALSHGMTTFELKKKIRHQIIELETKE